MRPLAFSSMVLTASLVVVAPGCSKDKAADADKAAEKQADGAKAADAAAAGEAKPSTGLAAAAGNAGAALDASFPASIALVPEQAEFVLGLSPKSIVASPIYALVAAEMEQDEEFKSAMSSFKDCGIDPAKLTSLVVGISQTEDFVGVIVGEGVGEDAKASCLIKNIQKQAGDAQLADVVTQDGKKVIQFTDGRAYLVDDQTLAIATTAWQGTVGELIDGKGTPAISGNKKDLFTKVDPKTSIWGVADIPAEFAGMAPMLGAPPEMASVKNVAASIDLSNGAAMNLVAGFDTEANATSVATQLQTMLGAVTAEAPPELAGMMKSVKIEAAGTDLKVSMTATMADINAAKDASPAAGAPAGAPAGEPAAPPL